LYNFRRGVFVEGQRMLGMGMSPVDLLLDYYTAAANACDETIDSVTRYRCGTYVSDDEEWGSVIERFLDAFAGVEPEHAGAFGPIAGVAQTPVPFTLTDGDLIMTRQFKFAAKRSRDEGLVNQV